jgi:uncharacterized sulfatase
MMDSNRSKSKFFAQAWQEWLGKAKTDPGAQAKIDRVLKHPEFELYNIKNDPWEINNLANNPKYIKKVTEMHAQLKADMKKLNDSFKFGSGKEKGEKKKGKKPGNKTKRMKRKKS